MRGHYRVNSIGHLFLWEHFHAFCMLYSSADYWNICLTRQFTSLDSSCRLSLADSGWELKCQSSIISLHSLHSWFICYPEIWVEFTYTFWSYLSLALSFPGNLTPSVSGNLGCLDSYPWYCKPESRKSVDWAESPKSQAITKAITSCCLLSLCVTSPLKSVYFVHSPEPFMYNSRYSLCLCACFVKF